MIIKVYIVVGVLGYMFVVGQLISTKIISFINDSTFEPPKIILFTAKLFDEYMICDFNDCGVVLLMLLWALLFGGVVCVLLWLPAIIIGAVCGSLYYVRHLKRKEKGIK
jgi:hypothetical protein